MQEVAGRPKVFGGVGFVAAARHTKSPRRRGLPRDDVRTRALVGETHRRRLAEVDVRRDGGRMAVQRQLALGRIAYTHDPDPVVLELRVVDAVRFLDLGRSARFEHGVGDDDGRRERERWNEAWHVC